MDCKKSKELIILRSELTAEKRAELEKHLEGCPACRDFLKEELKLREIFQRWRPIIYETPVVSSGRIFRAFALAFAVLLLILLPILKVVSPEKQFLLERKEIWVLPFPYSRVVSIDAVPDEFVTDGKHENFRTVLWEYRLRIPTRIICICDDKNQGGGVS